MSLLTRLEAIEIIMSEINDNDLVISTTGMISREVFYIKERTSNFYMIGSMGLASSFGLGIAMINKPYWNVKDQFKLEINEKIYVGTVCDLPFF